MEEQRGKRKVLKGKIISDKMQKTAIVEVERTFRHPKYKKVVREKKKYKVDNPENTARIGDLVEIMGTRPLSKEKHWRVSKIVQKAKGAEETTKILEPQIDTNKQ